jgi:hypothetical protein
LNCMNLLIAFPPCYQPHHKAHCFIMPWYDPAKKVHI